jgi:DNA-binding NtrC family response regulator
MTVRVTAKSKYARDVRAFETQYLITALELHNDNVKATAAYLGINRTHFHDMLRGHGIPSYRQNLGNAAWQELKTKLLDKR